MSAVILQNEIVHYEVLGRGRPLIFLHGWVGSWRYWIPTMQAASISFRTYAIDLWGFGGTAKNPEYYSLDQQVNLLDSFLQELGIGKIALVGHGLGGILALMYANRYSNSVDRVMAISLPNSQEKINARMYSTSPAELAEWLLSRTPDAEAARLEAPIADPRAIQTSLNTFQHANLHAVAHNLNTPCLLVHGQNDPAIEPPSAIDPPSALPETVHQIIFEQSGHFPMLDEQSKFNRLVTDFLALSSGASPRQLQLKEEWKRRVR